MINTPTRLGHAYALLMLLFGILVAFIATRPPPRSSKKRKAGKANDDVEKGDANQKEHELTSHANEAIDDAV